MHEQLPVEQRECFGVVLELAVILQDWADQVCLIGGWAVYVLTEWFQKEIEDPSFRHRGSMDVDLAISWSEVAPDQVGEMMRRLQDAHYVGSESFQWSRELPGGRVYRVDMMTLPPVGHRGGVVKLAGHEFAPFWDGEAAYRSPHLLLLRGHTPTGCQAEAWLQVASVGGLLVAKTKAALGQGGPPVAKHVYDLFALIRTHPGGSPGLVEELRATLTSEELDDLAGYLQVLFEEGGPGPYLVAEMRAIEGGASEGYLTEARLTVGRLLRALGRQ